MGKIITIINQKGGVGKTTTTVNIGDALAQLGKKVLILDFDPQGNATTGLGVSKQSIDSDVRNILKPGIKISTFVKKTYNENLFVVPANSHLSAVELSSHGEPDKEKLLKNKLRPIAKSFDYILIDCPPSLGNLTINALTAANSVLIPVQAEYYALEGLTMLLNSIRITQKNYNPKLKIEGILVTMFDSRTVLSNSVYSELKNYFNKKVYQIKIPRSVRLAEAPSFAKSLVELDSKHAASIAYIDIAKEIIKNDKE